MTTEAGGEEGLEPGEEVRATGRAWLALGRPRVPFWLLARTVHRVVLTDRRLLVRPARRRSAPDRPRVELAAPLAGVTLIRSRPLPPFRQLRLQVIGGPEVVLELGPRQANLARAVADALTRRAAPPGPAGAAPEEGVG
ncbi:MAG: hypothetical protein M5U14_07465 [Acidimicrobiia bacterium]|nr:hypothetical protein [Acidimicrobiia bacterium]